MSVHLPTERERLQAAYARRDHPGRYEPTMPDQIALRRARGATWARALARRAHFLGTVLEVGCGSGGVVRWAVDAGADSVIGVDVLQDRLRAADEAHGVGHYVLGDGTELPLRNATVDTAICSTLFSSVLDDRVAAAISAEIDRVLIPSGVVLWFDFFRENPWNADVRAVRSAKVRALFPQYEMHLERVVLAPPIARRLGHHPGLASALERIPSLRTHLAGALWKNPDPQGRG